MSASFIAPEFEKKAFNCPYCGVLASQMWGKLFHEDAFDRTIRDNIMAYVNCFNCRKRSYWHDGKMVVPASANVEMPNPDMPEDCKPEYMEARDVVDRSPRAAAALLRLCLQKLMVHLEETGKNINTDIQSLVKKGLPEKVQKAADICRVMGNNAVHPGVIDINEKPEIAYSLFKLLNIIVETMISQEKTINEMYESLPARQREIIAERDEV